MRDMLLTCLHIFMDRLPNEVTRLSCVKALTMIAASVVHIDFIPILNEVLPILSRFLRKNQRALKLVFNHARSSDVSVSGTLTGTAHTFTRVLRLINRVMKGSLKRDSTRKHLGKLSSTKKKQLKNQKLREKKKARQRPPNKLNKLGMEKQEELEKETLDERKRPYNSMYDVKACTEQEIEDCQHKSSLVEDPMLQFMS